MPNEIHVSPMEPGELAAALDLYNHYVLHTTATFQEAPLTLEQFRAQTLFSDERFGAFALRDGGDLVGYCALAPFNGRCAYRSTGMVSVYLRPAHTGRGLGRLAVTHLEQQARQRSFHALIARICAENLPSIRLFERLGYEMVSYFREVGFKFGRFLDVVDYEKILGRAGAATDRTLRAETPVHPTVRVD